ncbi:hypothetical protein HanRHA438_Chr09g0409801 [Helianthus annuus]|nr:hypothetical protein HanRHA438_Chr09g0409801 [Helianthus annuus]
MELAINSKFNLYQDYSNFEAKNSKNTFLGCLAKEKLNHESTIFIIITFCR